MTMDDSRTKSVVAVARPSNSTHRGHRYQPLRLALKASMFTQRESRQKHGNARAEGNMAVTDGYIRVTERPF